MKTLITILVVAFSTASFASEWDVANDIIKDWSRPHYTGQYMDRGFIPQDNNPYRQQYQQPQQQNCYVTRDAWGRQILKCN